jgi:hypothetical protein
MVAHAGQPLHDHGDAVQRPQLPDKAVAAGALQQSLFNLMELAVGQPGHWSGRASAAQSVRSLSLPAPVPEMDALAGDAELAGYLGLTDAGGEQLGGAQPTGLEAFAFLLRRGTARDGWHGPILTGRARHHQTQTPVRPTPRTR